MKKRGIIFIVLLSVFFIIIGLIFTESKNRKENQVCFKNNCFQVQLAITPEEQKQGLMFRQNLNQDEGMLFVFKEEEEYPFWMENTLIPLDIIWINQNKEVVFVSENTPPCEKDPCYSVNPGKKAQYVLEIKGGTAQKIGLTVGDRIDINISLFKKVILW